MTEDETVYHKPTIVDGVEMLVTTAKCGCVFRFEDEYSKAWSSGQMCKEHGEKWMKGEYALLYSSY